MAQSLRIVYPGGTHDLPLRGDEPSINIGDLEFKAHYAFIRGTRPTIFFTSKRAGQDDARLFLAYKSNSEGFWRLGLGEGTYYKGIDYIVSTFLAMELQELFNTIFAVEPPTLPPPENVDNFMRFFFDNVHDQIFTEFRRLNSYRVGQRIVNEPVFNIIHTINTYEHYTGALPSYGGPIRRIGSTRSIFRRPYPLTNYSSFLNAPGWNNAPRELPGAAGNGTPPAAAAGNGTPPPPPRQGSDPSPPGGRGPWVYRRPPPESADHRIVEDYLREEIAAAGGAAELNTSDTFRVLGRVISRIFRPVGGPLEHVLDTTIKYPFSQTNPNGRSEEFQMNIYVKEYESTMTHRRYKFYIGFYVYRGAAYKHLVNVVPVDAVILQNGCYSQTVSTSIYIYKPLDYFEQCRNVPHHTGCSEEYSFIGYLFQQMWPLTEHEFPPETPAAAAPPYNITRPPPGFGLEEVGAGGEAGGAWEAGGEAGGAAGGEADAVVQAPVRGFGGRVLNRLRGIFTGGKRRTYRRKSKIRRNKSKKTRKYRG